LIGYLVVRVLVNYGHTDPHEGEKHVKKDNASSKKVSKEIGEYVDYEEVKREKSKT
jgi:hypothetical protein